MSSDIAKFELDTSRVMRNLLLLNTVIMPAKVKAGLTAAGNRFMIDTVIGLPTTPIKRPGYGILSTRKAGELRASGALFVNGKKKRDTTHYGEGATGKYQATVYGGTRILPMSQEACVVFNAPYAARQHEAFLAKTEQTAGIHYMSEKLHTNGVEYMHIIARTIRL